MNNGLDHAALKAKQRATREGFPETMGLRAHRGISWIGRAEVCGDDDARFIFLWIAFNAAYADEQDFQAVAPGERAAFVEYFSRLVALDKDQRIYKRCGSGFQALFGCSWKTGTSSIPSGNITMGLTGLRIGRNASRPQPAHSRHHSKRATPHES